MTKNTWTDDYGVTIKNVHGEDECRTPGACTIHSPSDHGMSGFPQGWRADRGFMERICGHGVGHPDPDERLEGVDAMHGCDGCCAEPEPEPEPEAVLGAEQPVDAEKLFTMDEFDKGTLMQFEAGVYVGMEKAHELAVSEITKLRDSFEAVIECYPAATGTEHTVSQLALVADTLDVLLLSYNKRFFSSLFEDPSEGE